jgi:ribosomal protein S18 acetylase RimI-like enzyme
MGRIVGYGLVVGDGEKAWLTGGLLPEVRGLGLGHELFSHLVRFSEAQDLSPWLEVLETNHAGLHIYRRLGFVERYQRGDTITMEKSTL